MSKVSRASSFAVVVAVLYIVFISWIYVVYTGSPIIRKQLQPVSPSQGQNRLLEEPKKDSEALKITVKDDPPGNVRLDLSHTLQKDSKVGILFSPEGANKDKTGASSLLSQLELLKNVKDKSKDSNPSIPDKNGLQSETGDKSAGPTVHSNLTPIPVMFKKNFKKMPDWETNDVYMRGDEPAPTVCPESWHKIKDPDFQKAYIPNIQMYLYKDLFNLSEWNRLARFNNPFGFMEYNYREIKNVVDLIPKPKVSQLLPLPEKDSCIRCAVVANGGILNGSKMGKEIDSHQYVFRMNGAVTEGHEEDVGHKTSVYVHTAYSLVASLTMLWMYDFKNIPKDEGIKYVMIPEGLRDYYWLQGLLSRNEVLKGEFQNLKPWTYYGNQLDESSFFVLHPDFLRYIRNRFMLSPQLNGPYWDLYRPTNGAFALFLALHACDTVDAYGFITETHGNYPNYYYEKEKTEVVFFANHDYNLEIKLWKKLHDAKIINLYQREEGQT